MEERFQNWGLRDLFGDIGNNVAFCERSVKEALSRGDKQKAASFLDAYEAAHARLMAALREKVKG